MKRILTGIKPTGIAHLGNYFGAIKPAIELSKRDDYDCFYFIADYHALTSLKDAEQMREYTYNIACTWLACGLDHERVVLYKQSDIKETFELNWILNNVTPKGIMNRAHAYKACVEKNEIEGADRDNGVNMGLYNYPILMASDILIFDSELVPVGIDQQQHIEIARDIANSFNNKYCKCFILPECHIESTDLLVGLDGRKMSKSYQNTIPLFADENTLRKLINKIVTDSTGPNEPKTVDNTIYKLYKLFGSKEETQTFAQKLKEGISWGDAKKELYIIVNNALKPMREKYEYLQNHREIVDDILRNGAIKARKISQNKMVEVRKAIGAVNVFDED